jgi:hypothetical protein
MKAITVSDREAGVAGLSLTDLPYPQTADNDVVVRVHAAGFTRTAPPADPAAKPTFLRYECFRSLAVRGDRWVLVPARWTPEYGYAVIISADSSHVISLNMVKNIADTDAAKNRGGAWECPEVGLGAKAK